MNNDLTQPHVHEHVQTKTTGTTTASESALNDLLCVVSPNEKGFWQCDVYDTKNGGDLPEWFATGEKGDDQYAVMTKASKQYPGIDFVAGVTGICNECGEEYFLHEKECYCGGLVNEP